MKFIVIILLLVISGVAFGQPSPALDPDYVVLKPKETFEGYWTSQFVGAVIETVWTSPVFMYTYFVARSCS